MYGKRQYLYLFVTLLLFLLLAMSWRTWQRWARVPDSHTSPLLTEIPDSNTNLALSADVPRDPYGGATTLSCALKTGYFHVEKIGARWWLCTPSGNVFFKQSLMYTTHDASFDVRAKYGPGNEWAAATIKRIQSWGFNAVDDASSWYVQPIEGMSSVPIPFVAQMMPEAYAMNNSVVDDLLGKRTYLDYNVKNMFYAMPSSYVPTWQPPVADYFDPGISTYINSQLQHEKYWAGLLKDSKYRKYLIGIVIGEADSLWGFGAGDADGNSKPSPHLGWAILVMSPRLSAACSNVWFCPNRNVILYPDTEVKSKTGLVEFLRSRYGTIDALNAAWGSNYTQWNSSGLIQEEVIGTPDGITSMYSHTLAALPCSRFSLQVLVNGTVVAGAGNGIGDGINRNPSEQVSDFVVGPYVAGSINQDTGKLMISFRTSTDNDRTVLSASTDGHRVTVKTTRQHGLWTGAKISITGTDNYNIVAQPVTVLDSYRFSFVKTGRFASEFHGEIALVGLPKAGDRLTVSYIHNGWGHGSGLLDEDGRHAWLKGDRELRFLSKLRPAIARDLDDFLHEVAYRFFSESKAGVAAYNKSFGTKFLYLGPDAISTWGYPSRAPVLKAAGETMDAMITSYGTEFSQNGLNYIFQYFGDKPIFDSFYATANADSFWAGFPDNETYHFATQAQRGQAYLKRLNTILNRTYPNGTHPYIGIASWYLDLRSEKKNWGLVSVNDNAYDGREAVSRRLPCSAPLQEYTCGHEAGDYGDAITPIRKANVLWLRYASQ